MVKTDSNKPKRKKAGGRPKGGLNKKTVVCNFIRDIMLPTIARNNKCTNPVDGLVKFLKKPPEEITPQEQWFMKFTIELMGTTQTPQEISESALKAEQIRANALAQGEQAGGGSTTNIMMSPSFPMGNAVEQLPVIDVEVEEPKKLPEPKLAKQIPVDEDDPL